MPEFQAFTLDIEARFREDIRVESPDFCFRLRDNFPEDPNRTFIGPGTLRQKSSPPQTARFLSTGLCFALAAAILLSGFPFRADAATTSYTYDSLNRLVAVDYGNGSTISYTYDDAGNMSANRLNQSAATAPTITSTNPLASGIVGVSYSQALAATGGAGPYTWSLASGSALPAELVLSLEGVISGKPASPGTATFTVQVSGTDLQSSTADFSLTITAPFAIWQAGKFTAGDVATGRTTPATDFEGDGMANLLEYAFGKNPKVADLTGIAPNVSTNKMQISFRCDASCTDITYTVQASSTLAAGSWTDIARSTGGAKTAEFNSSGSEISDTGTGVRTVTVTEKDAFTGKRFLRVKVTSP